MHILAFILIFVVGAIAAAGKGDYSGIAAIGKFIGGAILFFAMLVMVIIAACCLNSK